MHCGLSGALETKGLTGVPAYGGQLFLFLALLSTSISSSSPLTPFSVSRCNNTSLLYTHNPLPQPMAQL